MKVFLFASAAALVCALSPASAAPAEQYIYLECSDVRAKADVFSDPGTFAGNVDGAKERAKLFAALKPLAGEAGVDCVAASLQVMGPFESLAEATKDYDQTVAITIVPVKKVMFPE